MVVVVVVVLVAVLAVVDVVDVVVVVVVVSVVGAVVDVDVVCDVYQGPCRGALVYRNTLTKGG